MKRTYYARRNALIRGPSQVVGIVAVLLAILILAVRLIAPGVIVVVFTPLVTVSSYAANLLHVSTAVFTTPAERAQELDLSRAQIDALTAENATLRARVADLTALLGSRTAIAPGILASVVARPPESPYDVLVLDEGTSGGVAENAVVTGPGGVPLGRVAAVTGGSSRVLLFSAPHTNTPAWAGNARTPIVLTGAGGGAFESSAPKDAGLVAGDLVYAAHEGAAALGTIVRLDSDPSSAAVTLRIQPLINPFSLTWVLISRP